MKHLVLHHNSSGDNMIKAIIFDCFGVVYFDDFAALYDHFGGDSAKDAEYIGQFFFDVSKGKINWYEGIKQRLGVTKEQWLEAREKYAGYNSELLSYISELSKKYKIGMLTNIGPEGLEAFFDRSVIEPYFDVIVESGKLGYAKPEAQAYEAVAYSLGVRLEECVFTDDRQPYIDGAIGVGMKAILFKDTADFKKKLESLLSEVARTN